MGFEYRDRLSQAANDGEEQDEAPASEKDALVPPADLGSQEKARKEDAQMDLFGHAPDEKTPYNQD